MGLYINPKNEEKEEWLNGNATPITEDDAILSLDNGDVVICLVDNLDFTAAGVAYDEKELKYMMKDDGRDKEYFITSLEKLQTVCPDCMDYYT